METWIASEKVGPNLMGLPRRVDPGWGDVEVGRCMTSRSLHLMRRMRITDLRQRNRQSRDFSSGFAGFCVSERMIRERDRRERASSIFTADGERSCKSAISEME